jgi:hypothetical protein
MDEITGFPADGGTWDAELLNVSLAEQHAMQNASAHAIQRIIEGLVGDGKYLWHAFQHANDIGQNTNNNSQHVGRVAIGNESVSWCTDWMAQRCDTAWVNERAITVQFDKFNVNESIASFLVVRPAFAWIGYGAGQLFPSWNDAFTWDVGEPKSACKQTSPGVFEREWSYGTASMNVSYHSLPAFIVCRELMLGLVCSVTRTRVRCRATRMMSSAARRRMSRRCRRCRHQGLPRLPRRRLPRDQRHRCHLLARGGQRRITAPPAKHRRRSL